MKKTKVYLDTSIFAYYYFPEKSDISFKYRKHYSKVLLDSLINDISTIICTSELTFSELIHIGIDSKDIISIKNYCNICNYTKSVNKYSLFTASDYRYISLHIAIALSNNINTIVTWMYRDLGHSSEWEYHNLALKELNIEAISILSPDQCLMTMREDEVACRIMDNFEESEFELYEKLNFDDSIAAKPTTLLKHLTANKHQSSNKAKLLLGKPVVSTKPAVSAKKKDYSGDSKTSKNLTSNQRGILSSLSRPQLKDNNSHYSKYKCRFCDSMAMPGSDVCYLCDS